MGPILVTQRGGRRVLSFGTGLEQSSVLVERPASLTHEYTQIMLLSLLFVEARHITLLGLGAADWYIVSVIFIRSVSCRWWSCASG